jgi:D-3-phosphoglycerate dehydrogenase
MREAEELVAPPLVLLTEQSAIGKLLGDQVNLQYVPGLTRAELREKVSDADAIIVRNQTIVTADIIEAATRLRVIGRLGAGLENIDIVAVRKRGAEVVYAPDANTVAVAEYCVAQILNISRLLPWAHDSVRRGEWTRSEFTGREMGEITVGIVGFGLIGRKVAQLLKIFGTKILVNTRRPGSVPAEFHNAELDELFSRSDIVSLHVPATQQTRHLVNARTLSFMQGHAALINTSRGSVVDESALLEVLRQGRLAYAALDVRDSEPPATSGLMEMAHVLSTPHIAAFTHAAQLRVDTAVANDVLAVLAGQEPMHRAP